MARQARGSIGLVAAIIESSTAQGIASNTSQLGHAINYTREMNNGTADGEIDRVWSTRSGTVTAASPVTIDLAGSINSVLDSGVTVVLVDLQFVVIKNTASSGNLIVGTHANNVGFIGGGTSGSIVIPPGGWIAIDLGTSGLAIGAGSSDILEFDASAGTVTYEVMFCGRSA